MLSSAWPAVKVLNVIETACECAAQLFTPIVLLLNDKKNELLFKFACQLGDNGKMRKRNSCRVELSF